ncbi:hypothetical protein [Terrabacter terrigena]|uniref:Uncharacterized protein n=1 Tax=Terrabacter terrigena TaxID=574718 RepID=A0ABW3MV77_9MICO
MMRRLIVLDLFSGPGWRDASNMVGHVPPGDAGAWLFIQADRIEVVAGEPDDAQLLRDADDGGPSFYCRAWRTTSGPDRPTVHTVASGDADLYEEVLLSVGFRTGEPEGIRLEQDESGAFWGYYA